MATLAELQSQVASLREEERASLASFLIESLQRSEYDVSDQELATRAQEINDGKVVPVSFEELRKGVMSDLGKK